MTDQQFILLLKDAFADYYFENHHGSTSSCVNILELLEIYKKQISKNAIKNYKEGIMIKNFLNNIKVTINENTTTSKQ